MTNAQTYHIPVLRTESIDGLNIRPNGVYADVTFGGGGHSQEIVRRLGEGGRLFGFDQDSDAMNNLLTSDAGWLANDPRFVFIRSNFRYISNWMRYYGVSGLDGIMADLGVSSHHLDEESRGFSLRFEAPLDMRMNKNAATTAADIVNLYSESQLADIFYLYGELKNARRIASAIVRRRGISPILTTGNLQESVTGLFHKEREKKDMARLFQALRIEVNQEMRALGDLLKSSVELLKPGGRLVVSTYHSLEDRLVKNLIRSGNIEGKVTQDFYGRTQVPLEAVNTKVILPSEEEIAANPRSRSAKLRIAKKK